MAGLVDFRFIFFKKKKTHAVGRQNKKQVGSYFFFLSELFYLHRSIRHAKDQPTMALGASNNLVKHGVNYKYCLCIIGL